ncbi:hypothetical protein A1Q2_04401 [Trichosporon asahii var. asahii CBS 8904]|uniref:Uncharacterized protein n=1 Tax=Trichosporon asahii var. asahii (strain CBS 8904) TaxID=1220162 RepID=K1VWW6_TRIAC|nr:hypothetical protein A1Q2_04401 [Trichosporon asahii var. asahii CBS 8904]
MASHIVPRDPEQPRKVGLQAVLGRPGLNGLPSADTVTGASAAAELLEIPHERPVAVTRLVAARFDVVSVLADEEEVEEDRWW